LKDPNIKRDEKMQVNFAGNKGSFRLKEILEEKNNELPKMYWNLKQSVLV
jgi:hypothetical protein